MFEGLVSDLLIKYLGQYLKNLNKDALKIGIWGGDVVLKNLELKEEALNSFNLPFAVKKGVVGNITLKVPWKALKSQPVIVLLENVFVLATPDYSYAEYDPEKEIRKEKQEKKSRLENAELMKSMNSEATDSKEDEKSDSFTQRLVTKIIDNLQININKIHVRLEDFTTNKEYPFTIGFCLDSISVRSTDLEWREQFIENRTDKLIYKLAKMQNLSMYYNPLSKITSLAEVSTEEMANAFEKLIATSKDNKNNHHFLLNPISAYLRLIMNTSDNVDKNIPKIDMSVVFEDIAVELEEIQYRTLLKLVDAISAYERAKKFLKFRPVISVKDPGGARKWWKYALDSVLVDIKEKANRKSWNYILQRRMNRREYTQLYKRTKKAKWLTPLSKDETKQLEALEERLGVDDILFFRSLADAEFKKEAQNAQELEEYQKKQPKKGLLSRFWGSSSTENSESQEEKPTISLSAMEREELYNAIDYKDVLTTTILPRDYVKNRINVQISSGSLTLHSSNGKERAGALITATVSGMDAKVKMRPDSMHVGAKIKSFNVDDKYTQNNKFPQMIGKEKTATNVDLLDLEFEQNPLDGHADIAVKLVCVPLDIIVNKAFLERIGQFFVLPDELAVADIKSKAMESVNTLSAVTRAQLEDALQTHKSVDLNVNIQAPTIIIPENATIEDSPLLVLDLGHLKVRSEVQKIDKSEEQKYNRKESDYYDHFELSLTEVKMLLVPKSVTNWKDSQVQKSQNMQLIEDFDIRLKLENCIQPTEVSLTKMKLNGELPSFRINFSAQKYGQLMKLIQVLTAPAPGAPQSARKLTNAQAPSTTSTTSGTTNVNELVKELEKTPEPEKNDDEKKILAKRKIIDAEFKIPKIEIAVSSKDEKKIIVLHIEGLGVQFVQKTYGMNANLSLHSLVIEDCLQQHGPEFRYLATSNKGGESSDLIQIKYLMTAKESPEWTGVDANVDVIFGVFYFIINRETVSALIEFGMNDLLKQNMALQQQQLQAAKSERRESVTIAKQQETENAKKTLKPKPKSNIKMATNVKFGKLGVMLNRDGAYIAEFGIKDIQVSLNLYESSMDIKGKLGDISLTNLKPLVGGEDYSEIMSIVRGVNEDMLHFTYITHSTLETDYPGYDSFVTADMRSIKFVFLNAFVADLTSYFMDGPIMATLLRSSAEIAMESAKMGIEKNVTASAKMRINATMTSPVIIVPRSSRSKEHLEIDLGDLTVTNEHKMVLTMEDDVPVEAMSVKWNSMNIKSVLERQETKELTSLYLLTDLSTAIDIQRLLDTKYNNQVNEMKIGVLMGTIDFLLSEKQFALIMGILNENLKEGVQPAKKPAQPQIAAAPKKEEEAKPVVEKEQPPPSEEGVVSKLELSVELSRIQMSILRGYGKLADKNDSGSLDPIATFQIEAINTGFEQYHDGSMSVQLGLDAITLVDSRTDSTSQFRRLLAPNATSEDDNGSQIRVSFAMNPKTGQTIEVGIHRPQVVLVPDALYAIKDFFVPPTNGEVKQIEEVKPEEAPAQPQVAAAPPSTVSPAGNIVASVSIVAPEIVLLNDPTKVDTRAIIINTSLAVSFTRTAEIIDDNTKEMAFKDNAEIAIERFQAFVNQPSVKNQEVLPIVKPFDMKLVYYAFENSQKVAIDLQSIAMLLSYQDFKLMMSILNSLQPPNKQPATPAKSTDVVPAKAPQAIAAPPAVTNKSEIMSFKCPCILFTLINDYEGRNIRLAEFRMSDMVVTALNWSSDLEAEVWFLVMANYYNDNISQFEPLIESWPCHAKFYKTANPKMQLQLESQEILNLNVSDALIDTLAKIMDILQKDYYRPLEADIVAKEEQYYPYWVFNESGRDVTVTVGENSIDVPYGDKIPLKFLAAQKHAKLEQLQEKFLSFKLKGIDQQIENISLDKVGKSVQLMTQDNVEYPLISEVELVQDSKILTLRSLVQIINDTNVALEVHVFTSATSEAPERIIGPVNPLTKISLPLENSQKSFLAIKPVGESKDYPVSTKQTLLSITDLTNLTDKTLNTFQHCFDCPASNGSFYAKTSLKMHKLENYKQIHITIAPPIILENLLPVAMRYNLTQDSNQVATDVLVKCDQVAIYTADPRKEVKLQISGVEGYKESKVHLVHNPSSFDKVDEEIQLLDNNNKVLALKTDNRLEENSRKISIYSPYWIQNQTDLVIQYSQDSISKDEVHTLSKHSKLEDAEELPNMFAFNGPIGGGKLVVQIDGSQWSSPFNVETVGTNGAITVRDKQKKLEYHLGVSLYVGKGQFQRTKIVEFYPRFVVSNESSKDVSLRQVDSMQSHTIKSGSKDPLYSLSTDRVKNTKQLCLMFEREGYDWSGSFDIDQLAEFTLKLNKGSKNSNDICLVPLVINQEYATIYIHIKDGDINKPPYKIENQTSLELYFAQKDLKSTNREVLPSRQSVIYTWDQPSKPRTLIFQDRDAKYKKEILPDVIEILDPFKIKEKTVYAQVKADGPTKILIFTEDDPKLKENVEEIVDMDVDIYFKGLGISFVDYRPKEVAYISVQGVKLQYSQSNLDQKILFVINNFQIDNQLIDAHNPVLLGYVQTDPKLPFFQLSMVKSLENTTVDYFNYFSVLMQPLHLKVDDIFLNEFLDFYNNLNLGSLSKGDAGPPVPSQPPRVSVIADEQGKYAAGTYYFTYSFYPGKMGPIAKCEATSAFSSVVFSQLEVRKGFTRIFYASTDKVNFHRIDTLACKIGSNTDRQVRFQSYLKDYSESTTEYNGTIDSSRQKAQPQGEAKRMYFKLLMLNPIKLYITFNMMPKESSEDSTRGPLRILTQVLGSAIANIDNAPIQLNALVLDDAFGTSSELVGRITQHYTRQGIQEVYKILGSVDLLGNPVGLFNSFGTGFKDFFFEPAQGLIKGPKEFGKGLTKGTISLVKNSVYGTFNTVSKLSGTVGKGLATLTLDDEYIKRRQKKAITERPRHVGEGLLYGAKDFGIGLFEGVSGIVVQPVKGAAKEGPIGFAKGLGRGLLGIGLKPVVGTIDFVSKTTEGIRNTTTMGDKVLDRSRFPRKIGADKVLEDFSETEAKGMYFLELIDDGVYHKEKYYYHQEIEGDMFLLTDKRVIMANKKELRSSWSVELTDITEVDLANLGVLIRFNHEPNVAIVNQTDKNLAMMVHIKVSAAIKSLKSTSKKR